MVRPLVVPILVGLILGPKALGGPLMGTIIGGINELVLKAKEEGRASQLVQLVAPASQLVRTVTQP